MYKAIGEFLVFLLTLIFGRFSKKTAFSFVIVMFVIFSISLGYF